MVDLGQVQKFCERFDFATADMWGKVSNQEEVPVTWTDEMLLISCMDLTKIILKK